MLYSGATYVRLMASNTTTSPTGGYDPSKDRTTMTGRKGNRIAAIRLQILLVVRDPNMTMREKWNIAHKVATARYEAEKVEAQDRYEKTLRIDSFGRCDLCTDVLPANRALKGTHWECLHETGVDPLDYVENHCEDEE